MASDPTEWEPGFYRGGSWFNRPPLEPEDVPTLAGQARSQVSGLDWDECGTPPAPTLGADGPRRRQWSGVGLEAFRMAGEEDSDSEEAECLD